MNNLLNNQYYNLTEWKIRKFCGKYEIEYDTDIGLQNVRRAPPWKVQVCGSSPFASPGSPTFSRRCLIIAKLLQLPIVSNTCNQYLLSAEWERSQQRLQTQAEEVDRSPRTLHQSQAWRWGNDKILNVMKKDSVPDSAYLTSGPSVCWSDLNKRRKQEWSENEKNNWDPSLCHYVAYGKSDDQEMRRKGIEKKTAAWPLELL